MSRANNEELHFGYTVQGEQVSKEKYQSVYLSPYLEKSDAIQCLDLMHYMIFTVFFDSEDPAVQALIHYDSDRQESYIRILQYTVVVYVCLDFHENICIFREAIFQ